MDYNRRHGHHGTIWESRFKSILVEPDRTTLLTVATYLEANPVKAGLVRRAGDYRWSGFGAALQGSARARDGLLLLVGAAICIHRLAGYVFLCENTLVYMKFRLYNTNHAG